MSKWLTDKEKMILFSALTREKRACIKVDKQCKPREPYVQSLQSVCESLEHKFYYDRLFKQMEKQIREETIDDFLEKIKERAFHDESYLVKLIPINYVEAIANQLKEGENNG